LDEVLSTTIKNYELSYSSETANLSEILNKAIRIETLKEASENYRSSLKEAEQKASKLLQDVIYE
jgi:competence protein ComGC